VAVGVTLFFIAIMLSAPATLLGLLGARPDVIDAGLPYLRLIVGSSVILSVILILDAGQRANRNTRTPMLISIAMTAVKLVGNVVLIFGQLGFPRLGLLGAGLATLISQLFGLVIYLWLMSRMPDGSPLSIRFRSLLRPQPLRRQVLRIAAPGIAERVVLNLGLLSYFWILSNYYGTIAVAAYTVGVPLLSFSWIPGNGYAQACATLVGQRLGARDPTGASAIGKRAALLAVGTAIPLGTLFALMRFPLARLFTDDLQVIAALGPFMFALALGQPFLQLHFTLGGAHRGAGDTWTPLLGATIGNWLFRVPLALLFAVVLEWDVVWVWYALIVDHMARAALLVWSFRRGRWKTRRVDV
jgi:putative MATE family efflux protein